jgi:hypothetical protein
MVPVRIILRRTLRKVDVDRGLGVDEFNLGPESEDEPEPESEEQVEVGFELEYPDAEG